MKEGRRGQKRGSGMSLCGAPLFLLVSLGGGHSGREKGYMLFWREATFAIEGQVNSPLFSLGMFSYLSGCCSS